MTSDPIAEPWTAELVRANLDRIRERITAAGGSDDVTVVAVTKTFPEQAARAAVSAGLGDLGENYADELISKATALEGIPARWHLVGGIQRRTLARQAPFVSLYQSVDRLEEGAAIARHAPGAAVLVEVDTTGLPGRGGVTPTEAPALVEALGGLGLSVKGLMTVAAPDDPSGAHRTFAAVRALVDSLGLAVASMGMSEDFELAVAEGSTMVRIGRALFGHRPAKQARSDA